MRDGGRHGRDRGTSTGELPEKRALKLSRLLAVRVSNRINKKSDGD